MQSLWFIVCHQNIFFSIICSQNIFFGRAESTKYFFLTESPSEYFFSAIYVYMYTFLRKTLQLEKKIYSLGLGRLFFFILGLDRFFFCGNFGDRIFFSKINQAPQVSNGWLLICIGYTLKVLLYIVFYYIPICHSPIKSIIN